MMLHLRMLPLIPPEITPIAMETLTAEQTLLAAEVMPELSMLPRVLPKQSVCILKNLNAEQTLHGPKRISVVSLPRIYI